MQDVFGGEWMGMIRKMQQIQVFFGCAKSSRLTERREAEPRERGEGRGRKGARSERENEREREVRSNNVRAKASTAFPCEGADRKG